MESIFETNPVFLASLLNDLAVGKIQLPDFQRGWVWDDKRIRDVIASVSRSFPVGAVMMLETGGEARFHPHPVEGVTLPKPVEPEVLVLDGQQRLTSLFQATKYGKVVKTVNARNQEINRWFYIDIKRALNAPDEREEAIIGVPEDRVLRTLSTVILDLSTPEKEFEKFYFPCTKLFEPFEWQNAYLNFWKFEPEKTQLFARFLGEVLQPFQSYQIPIIRLKKTVTKEAVCHVFEKVNTGGIVLNAFELLTAIYAADDFRLRDCWYGNLDEGIAGDEKTLQKRKVLQGVQNTDFLQGLALIHTWRRQEEDIRQKKPQEEVTGVNGKKAAVLALPLEAFKGLRPHLLNGFVRAAKFLTQEHIFSARDLPYQTQIVPLAAILAELGDSWEDLGTKNKIRQWYWCGVLGELYGGATESRAARDLPEVIRWIKGSEQIPTSVRDAHFNPDRLLTLRSRNSAAYKGIYALLMKNGALEFRSDVTISFKNYEEEKIDIHHIFPKVWCKAKKIERKRWDSIINKTAISARTNRIIGGKPPSEYLAGIERQAGIAIPTLDRILGTHYIAPKAMRRDDFNGFFEARRLALLDLISGAIGKPVGVSDEIAEPVGEILDQEEDADEATDLLETA